MKSIGIFGGTFDPIHSGHLFLAKVATGHFHLDETWFLPLNIPPHKEHPAAAAKDRLSLIHKAIVPYPAFRLCDIELRRPGVTYTVDTLSDLKKQEHGHFYYIIGSDTLIDLRNWKSYKEVFHLCSFICVKRPGTGDLQKTINRLRQDGADIHMLSISAPDISSSMIKCRLQNQLDISQLVPECIYTDVQKIYK